MNKNKAAGAIFGCLVLGATVWTCAAAPLSRSQEILLTAKAIELECQKVAGGDWQKWFDQTAGARKVMGEKIGAIANSIRTSPDGKIKEAVFRRDGKPPIFLPYLFTTYVALYGVPDIKSCDDWLARVPNWKTVITVSAWLKAQGIDLVLVPVPHMAEVYGARIGGYSPDNAVITPHIRREFLELLQHDVEVVDLLPQFLEERGDDSDPLFLMADPHWADRGKIIAAKEIARRLKRYPWAASAAAKPPLFSAEAKTFPVFGSVWAILTDSEKAELGPPAVIHANSVTSIANGKPPEAPSDRPIMVIGDSYVDYNLGIPGTSFYQQLDAQLNQLVTIRVVSGGDIQTVKEMARDPEMIKETKVVIWLMNGANFSTRWPELPQLPAIPKKAAREQK